MKKPDLEMVKIMNNMARKRLAWRREADRLMSSMKPLREVRSDISKQEVIIDDPIIRRK